MHHLHRGIALKQQAGQHAAANHLHKSVSLKPNPLALQILGRDESSWALLLSLPASALRGHNLDFARDLAGVLSNQYRLDLNWTACATLINTIQHLVLASSTYLLRSQPLRVVQVALVLYHKSGATRSIGLLMESEGWSVSTPGLVPLWRDAWYKREEKTIGRVLNLLDKARVRRASASTIYQF